MHLGPTPSQTTGPYLSLGLLGTIGAELAEPTTPGALQIHGRVLDGAGEPVPDALVELWQADAHGNYAAAFGGFGRSATVDGGRFRFDDALARVCVSGGGGELQAPHLNIGVFARGLLKRVVTRMYFPDEAEANDLDPTLAAIEPRFRETLVAVAEPDGSLRFDIRLQGDDQTVFFAL